MKREVLRMGAAWRSWTGYVMLAMAAFALTFVVKWALGRPLLADCGGLLMLSASGPLAAGAMARRRAAEIGMLHTSDQFFAFYRNQVTTELRRMRVLRWITLAMTALFAMVTLFAWRVCQTHAGFGPLLRAGAIVLLGSVALSAWTNVRISRSRRLMATLAA
jgi:hypothetical protein